MMAVARFLAIFVMVGGSLYALMFDRIDSQISRGSAPYLAPTVTDEEDESLMSYSFAFSGFGVMFSTALFSQLFQHSVPGLIRPLPEYQKRKVPQVFMKALATTMTLYLILGISAACYFGSSTSSSVNLNFTNFSYGINLEEAPEWQVWLVKVLSNVVVLFPAADTLSVFPLIANTLGNNLSTSSPGLTRKIRTLLKGRGWTGEELKTHTRKVNMIIWRLVASVPPIVASVYAKDLAFSLQLAGLAGLYVAFVCPALLQRASSNAIKRNFGEAEVGTIYSGCQSKREVEIVVLVFSLFAFVVVMSQIRTQFLAMAMGGGADTG
jgi:amino acid permease